MSRYAKGVLTLLVLVGVLALFISPRFTFAGADERSVHEDDGGTGNDAGCEGEHGASREGKHDEHEAEQRIFSVRDFENAGVRLLTAGAGDVDAAVELPGEVRPNGDRIAHLAPRFSGIVREVRRYVGDHVRAGDVLAVVESENLSTFEVRSAFDGTVIEKHITPGEAVTRDRPVYVVADLSTVWVDISIYHTAVTEVHVGQSVGIRAAQGKLDATGTISYVTPVVDPATRTATARIVLPNPDGRWRPGLFVTATILTPVRAATVIPHDAIQTVEGKPSVFVAEGERFEPREVVIGRMGRTNVEVISGLGAGERYAAERSFLVKAELTKGEAGHEH